MKWLKLYSTLHDQPESQATIRKLGYEWYGRYLVILAECAAQYDGEKSATTFTLHVDQFKSTLRVVGDKWQSTLKVLAEYQGFTFEVVGEFIILNVPIISELHHKDSTSSKIRRATLPTVAGRDLEEEGDKTKNKKKSIPKEQSEASKELNRKVWDAYSQSYFDRYKTEPVRNASVNAKISQLAKRLGVEAIDVVKFYLGHNDTFYLKNLHSIGLCLTHAESLRTQWARGKAITNRDVKNFEKSQEWRDMKKDYEEGGF